MKPIEEFIQLLSEKKVQRIMAPDLMYGLISVAEKGNDKPLIEAIALLKEKLSVLEAIDAKFEKTMKDIVKDFELGVITVKSEERKNKMKELRQMEKMEAKDLEEALTKSLNNT